MRHVGVIERLISACSTLSILIRMLLIGWLWRAN